MSLPATFDLTPEDAQLLLASNAHLGARNVQVCTKSHMTLYPWTVISVEKKRRCQVYHVLKSQTQIRTLKGFQKHSQIR